MNVPFLSLDNIHQPLKEVFLEAFSKIIEKNNFILGDELAAFEIAFSKYCDSKYFIGVGCGLDALKICLKSLNIKKGDEVIVPAHTFIATWLAVSETGATIVTVDALADTMNMDSSKIEEKITQRTKAIIPVHMYGQMCDMDKISAIAIKHNIHIIEDFAQAHGAQFDGKAAGSWGIVNATSFYPGKNLGALGDGGGISCCDEKLYHQILKIRNYGSVIKYYHEIQGLNSRLDNLQAAFLNIKLKHLNSWNTERQGIAALYSKHLNAIESLKLPSLHEKARSSFHLYVIRTERRAELQNYLSSEGIACIIHYPIPPHLQMSYKELNFSEGSFPIAENIARTGLSLPIYPGMQENQVLYVVEKIKEFFKN